MRISLCQRRLFLVRDKDVINKIAKNSKIRSIPLFEFEESGEKKVALPERRENKEDGTLKKKNEN